jgi:hypothetical protein
MMTATEVNQRKLVLIFREMKALFYIFPSRDWSPEDAQALLDVLSRRSICTRLRTSTN